MNETNRQLESLVIELTNHCNAVCVYCTNRFMKRNQGFMDDSLFEKIIKDCKDIDTLQAINIQMHGEPTLVPDLIDKLRHIKAELPDIRIEMISNGERLTPEMVELVDHIDVSFNYANKGDFEKGTGLSQEKVKDNILKLGHLKHKVTVHYVLEKEYAAQYEEVKKMFPGYIVSANPLFNDWNKRIQDRGNYKRLGKIVCDRIRMQMPILWDGRAVLCCCDYEGETSQYIGNVKDMHVKELFDSSYLNDMQEKNIKLKYEGTFCETCNQNERITT